MQRISVASLEPVRAYVRHLRDGVVTDPTGDVVQFGFAANPRGGEPDGAPEYLFAGAWESGGPDSRGRYAAFCNIGPGGGTELAVGRYWGWVKVIDDPEVPFKPFDEIYVF